ncbi:enoyl-CoA hydratase [Defluviimonas sp. 20V17]|uniref:3-hydroxyacyl-CoA dehydrogenase n=1 Tax=Allgaiera indica TaxID=765699 RepID=A0AAN4UTG8_9RHOB|nr:3-hydroxyacyl-CoA dehydrogenase NAD-binding domain-containing protein [Allgaiera indica]KDB02017.1 enoyl-CoA hydratase [Defluviimonas sp. 20V17]GHE03298.1 3-hydroxyacyl-CoA dehydrogenase [Allgaiera indica]SDX23025.1 short chain enoyl-CoA hydratase /3-hydroxyacyl-CoA dehydrogenase [Allgaiera indica]
MAVSRVRDGMCGHVQLNNPPINGIDRAVRRGLLEAVDWAEAEGLERVILSGAGRAFAAGVDAREFDLAPEPPHLSDVLDRIERSHVPWIAAIHGQALGGGAEIALACRYRIARPDATLGLPDVTLGMVPGAGGTQRLPRLSGIEVALDLIATGRVVSGVEAKRIGLVDALGDDPVAAAATLRAARLGLAVPVGKLNPGDAPPEVFEAARRTAARRMRGQVAPLRAIELIARSCTATLAQGLEAERATVLELRASDQGRALRHAFFAERSARAPGWLRAGPAPLRQVAVVGGGILAAGLAYALLNAGLGVTLLEADTEGVVRARANGEKFIEADLARGRIGAVDAASRRAGFSVSADYADAAGADLAIEAVGESMEERRQVFARLQSVLRPDAVLASTTARPDLNLIAAGLADPARLLGLHFCAAAPAPAPVAKLVEIIRGAASSDRTLATGFALAAALGKTPVLAGVCDGFIGNRILARCDDEADALLIEGSTPWDIDEAMVDFGYAMGPYERQDLAGLDIAHANRRRRDAGRDPARRCNPISDRMVAEGRLGRKTAVGWYRYPGGGGKVLDPLIEDLIREEAYFAKVARREFSADQIRRRLLLAMINEASEILAEGIAERAADIDLVTLLATGFPRWRGGLMHYADTLGAKAILAGIEDQAKAAGLDWRPSRVIEECAAKGLRFSDWRR